MNRQTHAVLLAVLCNASLVGAGSIAFGQGGLPCMRWTQRSPQHAPEGRVTTMAYDSARGVTVLFGGGAEVDGEIVYLGDTWEYDGNDWTLCATSGPEPRAVAAMAYDSARGVTVLHGGGGTLGLYGDTWEWDGVEWTQRSTTGPCPRWIHAMTYDSIRGVSVLFGGRGPGGCGDHFGDTWEWDGVEWTLRSTSGPDARDKHGLAYDSARGVSVLCRGYALVGSSGQFYKDIWEWDGTEWTYRGNYFVVTWVAGGYGQISYDSIRQRTYIHGGGAPGPDDEDTWYWTGTAFGRISPSPRPTTYSLHGAAFDSARGVTIVFGGYSYSGGYLNETWEFGNNLEITQQPESQTTAPGGVAVFSVVATGSGSFTYQWNRDGQPLIDDDRIIGSAAATLTIDPVQSSDMGEYDVVVSNVCGAVQSNSATLDCPTVVGDIDFDCDIDLDDFTIFADCMAGPDVTTPPPGCAPEHFTRADLEGDDGDVDLADFATFQQSFGGE